MKRHPLTVLLAFLWLLAACTPTAGALGGGGGGVATASVITVAPAGTTGPGIVPNGTVPPFPTPEPPTPIPTLPAASLSPTELKYRLLAKFPNLFFCDPDYYPIARADEGELARERFPELQANQEEFQAILAHNGLSGLTAFTDDQKLLIYREHKKLAAIYFGQVNDRYHFQLQTGSMGGQGQSIQGLIDGSGNIQVLQQMPTFATCPICLAMYTQIDTPHGAIAVEDIKVGDSVWTLDASGQRVAMPVLKVVRVPVSAGHLLVHVRLDDGRELWASPGHPTADGRQLGALQPGDMLDGSHVVQVERYAYDGPATYDLLPAGATGFYWADGILMGSTLSQ